MTQQSNKMVRIKKKNSSTPPAALARTSGFSSGIISFGATIGAYIAYSLAASIAAGVAAAMIGWVKEWEVKVERRGPKREKGPKREIIDVTPR